MLKQLTFKIKNKKLPEFGDEIIFQLISTELFNAEAISVEYKLKKKIGDDIHVLALTEKKSFDLVKFLNRISKTFEISLVEDIELDKNINWIEKSNQNYNSIWINQKLWIGADWHVVPKKKFSFTIVKINPSMAFGTGLHETTRLCLESLSKIKYCSNDSFLDCGCGSGILGISAHLLGCKNITFVDNDEISLKIAKSNSIKNGCSLQNFFYFSSISNTKNNFKYIYANILLDPLKKLAPLLIKKLQISGTIVLSGIYKSQESSLKTCFFSKSNNNLKLKKINRLKNWTSIEFTKIR